MKPNLKRTLIVVVILAVSIGLLNWLAFHRVSPQPAWITSDQRDNYFYGSISTGKTAGLPYWIWLAMPRLFPEHMPGPGGYAALGMSWEEGKEMPAGFAKQRIGYIRVTGNCALCHAISRTNGVGQPPTIFPALKGVTTDLQPLLNFFRTSAQDPRFNADEFFAEIDSDTKLSWLDKLLYRYVFIPDMRKALIDDPAKVLFTPEVLAHARDPHSAAPLMEKQSHANSQWMTQQMHPLNP